MTSAMCRSGLNHLPLLQLHRCMLTHPASHVDLLQVGFIGLGKMGSRMVKNLLDAGTTVVAYDQNRLAVSRAQEMAKKNHPSGVLEARNSPADISSDPEVPVVSMQQWVI